jgi:hypothetical protein
LGGEGFETTSSNYFAERNKNPCSTTVCAIHSAIDDCSQYGVECHIRRHLGKRMRINIERCVSKDFGDLIKGTTCSEWIGLQMALYRLASVMSKYFLRALNFFVKTPLTFKSGLP